MIIKYKQKYQQKCNKLNKLLSKEPQTWQWEKKNKIQLQIDKQKFNVISDGWYPGGVRYGAPYVADKSRSTIKHESIKTREILQGGLKQERDILMDKST